LPNGIPSHDTFGRFFSLLDPLAFQERFVRWVSEIQSCLKNKGIAIDGKTLRRSYDTANGNPAIQMVSAWATEAGLVLGQVKTDSKSNEIKAIPQLLEVLELSECIVSIDAAGCQKAIAKQIKGKGGDYVLALKGNQGGLHDFVKDFFDTAVADHFEGIPFDFCEEIDGGHGRVETRRCWFVTDFPNDPSIKGWCGLKGIAMIESIREIEDNTSTERRYYITSLNNSAKEVAQSIRNHWGIENQLHWCLDIGFREDDCRVRQGFAAENFATIRHIALNLLKQNKRFKAGVKGKRLAAGWDNDYLLEVLAGPKI